MVNYAKKALRGASITLIFGILASIIAYFTRIILARKLTPEDFGLFYAVFSFVIFFLFFRSLGLGQALVKYIAEFKVSNKFNEIKTSIISVFYLQIISSLIFSTIFFFTSDYLAKVYFKNPQASIILKILIVYVIFSIFFIISKQIFQGFQKMFLYSSVELSKNLIVLGLVIFFFSKGETLFSPVYAFALVCPLLFFLYLPSLLKVFNFSKHKITNTKTISKKLIYFGIPVFATSIGGKIIGYIDTLILTYFVSLTEVGIYNVVLPSALMFIFFSKAICSVIFPMSSELWALNNKKILIKGISIIHKYIFIIITPIILTAVYFSPALIRLLFGIEYVSGSLAFQILLLGVIFYVVASINNNLISGIGKPKTVTLIILSSAILNIILNIILIPKYSINGAAFATSISYLFMFVFSMYKAKKIIGIKFLIKEKLLTLISASFFYTTIILVEKSLNLNLILEVIISSIIATFVYLTLTYLFKLIDVTEIKKYTKF